MLDLLSPLPLYGTTVDVTGYSVGLLFMVTPVLGERERIDLKALGPN